MEGGELDQFLIEIGLDTSELLDDHSRGVKAALMAQRRARFENAKDYVRSGGSKQSATLLTFDLARKRQVLEDIKKRATQTNEMTLAARNQKIDAEEDLDSFLEACLRLGLIDDEGNLKE